MSYNDNPYGNMSGYASQFQNGSGVFNRNPVMQQQQMGVPGISTGNMFADMFIGNMIGNKALPQPNANQSMLEAMTLRRRSLEGFNRMAPNSFGSNAFAQNFGGFQGLFPSAFTMADSMTGGPGNGIMSNLLNPVLGGNPIQAQQRLYAGSNGITRTAAFGLRGEMSLNSSNNMMKDMSKWFYKQDRNDEDFSKFVSGQGINATNGLQSSLVKELKAAAESGATKDAFDTIAKKFGASIGKGVDEALNKRAKTTAFGGVNFSNSYGYKMEEITGGWIGLQHKGLIKSTGSERDTFREFGENGGMGMFRAAQNLFGSKDASGAASDMNDFIGVGAFNAASKADRKRFSTMAHSMEATSLSSGISKADILQLTESIREISKQSGMGKAVGGIEAGNMAMSAINRATTLAAGQSQDYLRRNGGVAGVAATIGRNMAEDAASMPAKELAGMYGYIDSTVTDPVKREELKRKILLRDKAMTEDPSEASLEKAIAFRKEIGRDIGAGEATIARIGADEVNIANGRTAAERAGASGRFGNKVTEAARLNAFLKNFTGGKLTSMQQAIEQGGNADEQIDIFNKLEYARLNNNSNALDRNSGSGAALAKNGLQLHAATATGRAEAAKLEAETKESAKMSAKMDRLWGGARSSLVGSVAQSLLSGSAASGGFEKLAANHINELIEANKGDPETIAKLKALQPLLDEGTRKSASLGAALTGLGNTKAGGYLGDVSLNDLNADLTKDASAGKKIEDIKKRLQADMTSPDEKTAAQAKGIFDSMFDKNGKLLSKAGARIMNSIGVASKDALYGNDASYREMLAYTNNDIASKLEGTGISLSDARGMGSDELKKKAEEILDNDKASNTKKDHILKAAEVLKRQEGATNAMEDAEGSSKDIMGKIAESLGEGSPMVKTLQELIRAITEAK